MAMNKFKNLLSFFSEERLAVQSASNHFHDLMEKNPNEAINFLSYLQEHQPPVLKKLATKNFNLEKTPSDSYWLVFKTMAENGFFYKRWNKYVLETSPQKTQDMVGFLLKSTLTVLDNPEKMKFFTDLLKIAFSEGGKIHKKVKENKYIYLAQIKDNKDLIELLGQNGLSGTKKMKM